MWSHLWASFLTISYGLLITFVAFYTMQTTQYYWFILERPFNGQCQQPGGYNSKIDPYPLGANKGEFTLLTCV